MFVCGQTRARSDKNPPRCAAIGRQAARCQAYTARVLRPERTCTAGVLQHPLRRSTPPTWPSAPSATMYTPTETQTVVNQLQLCGSAWTGANVRGRRRCLPNRRLVTPIVSPEGGPALSTPWSQPSYRPSSCQVAPSARAASPPTILPHYQLHHHNSSPSPLRPQPSSASARLTPLLTSHGSTYTYPHADSQSPSGNPCSKQPSAPHASCASPTPSQPHPYYPNPPYSPSGRLPSLSLR